MKRRVSLFDEYWIFRPNGEYLGIVRPRVSWLAYPLGFLLNGGMGFSIFFGLAYDIENADDKLIGRFRMDKSFKTVVNISDAGHQLIGTYRQGDWKSLKSLFNIHGELFTKDNHKILNTKVNNFSGNFRLKDINGKHWASLSSGLFPLQSRKDFKDSINPLIKLNLELTEQERIILLSMVTCWFLQIRRL